MYGTSQDTALCHNLSLKTNGASAYTPIGHDFILDTKCFVCGYTPLRNGDLTIDIKGCICR